MVITVSIDNNVTSDESIEFLKDIRVFDSDERLYLEKVGKTYVSLEVSASEILYSLSKIDKDSIYLSKLTDKGMSVFTTSDNDIRIFIPMHNIKAISNYSKLRELLEKLYL